MGGAATHPQQQLHTSLTHHSSPTPRRGRCHTRPHHFPQGSAVEVQTNEEDFQFVFFSATVLHPPLLYNSKHGKRKSKKLYVEYHNLLAHENGAERLREYVFLSFVRPAPPLAPVVSPLEPGDVVDAFYKDGWWTGVIKRALPGEEKYIVTFEHPPDELEFGVSDLRVHLDWVNGEWVRPQKQSVAGLMFDVGRKVEVSLDRENCLDAWFPATIHKHLGNGAFLVEYRSQNNDNKVQALKVTISHPHIRPCPPFLRDKNFVLLEKVDAFFDFGWWTGVITKELENGRYILFFKQLKREKEFYQSELRPHMEWKDGKWFTSSQDALIQSSDVCMQEQRTPENFSTPAVTVPLTSLDDKKDTCDQMTLSSGTTGEGHSNEISPDDQEKLRVASSQAKGGQHMNVPQNTLFQLKENLDDGNVVGLQDKYTHDTSLKDINSGSVSPVSVTKSGGEHLSDNPSSRKRTRRKQRNLDETPSVVEKVISIPELMNVTSIQMPEHGSPNHYVGGKELDSVGKNADSQNEGAEKETELHVIIGLPCTEKGKKRRLSNSKETTNLGTDQKPQLNDSTVQKMKDDSPLGIGGSIEKKRRGRPRKILLEGIQTAVAENDRDEVGSDNLNRNYDDPHGSPEAEVMEVDSSLNENELTDGHSDPKIEKVSKRKRNLPKMLMKKPPRLQGTHSSSRGRRLTPSRKVALKVGDSSYASRRKSREATQAMEMKNVVCEAPGNELDDEPLSKWIEGMHHHPPAIIDGLRPSPVSTVDQCMENSNKKGDDTMLEDGEKQPESGTDASALADTDSIGQSEPPNLPFVKNNILWETIEAMEVFRRIPQKPHFKPLENVKENAREGLAIGYMVTFSGVVEKTWRLQFGDPKSVTDDILETLADLERHGFEVKIVRDHINGLLAVKEKQKKHVHDLEVLNKQMLEHNHERSRIDEEIKKMNEDMRKLQEKISLAESAKEKQDGEIDALQTKLKETEEIIENLGSEFEDMASIVLGKI